jgi:hypothetical protein
MTTSEDRLDLLTDQVGRFTEGLTEFRMAMERNHQEFNQKLDRIAATTERQAETADRLVKIVELLVQQR